MNEARRAEVCSSSEPEQGAHLSLTALSASAELRRLAVSNRCTTVWQNCEQRLQVRCALNPQVSEILRSPRLTNTRVGSDARRQRRVTTVERTSSKRGGAAVAWVCPNPHVRASWADRL